MGDDFFVQCLVNILMISLKRVYFFFAKKGRFSFRPFIFLTD